MKYLEKIKTQIGFIIFLQVILLILLFVFKVYDVAIALFLILIIDSGLLVWSVHTMQQVRQKDDDRINSILGDEASFIMEYGKVGIIVYNEKYEIEWASKMFFKNNNHPIGKRISMISKNIDDLLSGDVDEITTKFNDNIYAVRRGSQNNILFIKDITEKENYKFELEAKGLVVGLIHLDNYRDYSAFEDETRMAQLNVMVRQPIVDWADKHGIIIRRLKSDQFVIVLNEEIYKNLVDEKFEILQLTKENAQKVDANITLSISFARGGESLNELDKLTTELLELAQSRGGDQVATQKVGDDVVFYGGKSESSNSRSRVRVRVMAQTIKEIVDNSNNIFIVGHKKMDFDCFGAALGVSTMMNVYGKKACIVFDEQDAEKHVGQVYIDNKEKLGNHNFISEEEALNLYNKNDLVIIVDHHDSSQSFSTKLVEKCEKCIVIDHHRRGDSFITNPLLVYLESSASSTCELISELIAYQPIRIDISPLESTIMYAGILVDTNRFRFHTSFRTFEACALLREWGCDISEAEQMLDEDIEIFEQRNLIYQNCYMYRDNVYISSVENVKMERSTLSIAADSLLDVKDIKASFVIGRDMEGKVCVSARSKKAINVQVIMEQLNGGGHFSAAAAQFDDKTCDEVEEMVKEQIDKYFEEEMDYESNID